MLRSLFLVVLLVALSLSEGFLLRGQACTTAADCPNTHCCEANECHPYHSLNGTQPCHFDKNHHHILYRCSCKTGYTCTPFHLSSTDATDDPLHAVDISLGKTGLGTCQPTSS